MSKCNAQVFALQCLFVADLADSSVLMPRFKVYLMGKTLNNIWMRLICSPPVAGVNPEQHKEEFYWKHYCFTRLKAGRSISTWPLWLPVGRCGHKTPNVRHVIYLWHKVFLYYLSLLDGAHCSAKTLLTKRPEAKKGLKSRPACQKGGFLCSVQLQLPPIVSHKTESNNQIPAWKQTLTEQSNTKAVHFTEGGKAKHQTWPCLHWHSFYYWGMSWYNARCLMGLHYGDKAHSPARHNRSHRFLLWYAAQSVCTIASSSELILLPAMLLSTSCWRVCCSLSVHSTKWKGGNAKKPLIKSSWYRLPPTVRCVWVSQCYKYVVICSNDSATGVYLERRVITSRCLLC